MNNENEIINQIRVSKKHLKRLVFRKDNGIPIVILSEENKVSIFLGDKPEPKKFIHFKTLKFPNKVDGTSAIYFKGCLTLTVLCGKEKIERTIKIE